MRRVDGFANWSMAYERSRSGIIDENNLKKVWAREIGPQPEIEISAEF
jgi:hypothetical protein